MKRNREFGGLTMSMKIKSVTRRLNQVYAVSITGDLPCTLFFRGCKPIAIRSDREYPTLYAPRELDMDITSWLRKEDRQTGGSSMLTLVDTIGGVLSHVLHDHTIGNYKAEDCNIPVKPVYPDDGIPPKTTCMICGSSVTGIPWVTPIDNIVHFCDSCYSKDRGGINQSNVPSSPLGKFKRMGTLQEDYASVLRTYPPRCSACGTYADHNYRMYSPLNNTVLGYCSACYLAIDHQERIRIASDLDVSKVELAHCTGCGVVGDSEAMTGMGDGSSLCPVCYYVKGEYFVKTTEKCNCPGCGGNLTIENILLNGYDGESYCDTCVRRKFTRCTGCGRLGRELNSYYIHGDAYCNLCKDRFFILCGGCSQYVRRSDIRTNGSGVRVCQTCQEKESHIIKNYSFKPPPVFYGDDLHLGIELEVEQQDSEWGRTDVAEYLQQTHPEIYCKHDSSLTYGFEIVSHPCSYQYMKDTGLFKEILTYLLSKNYKSFKSGNCGIHIHMSKSDFTTMQLYKFMKFFYENRDFIYYVSQRKNTDTFKRFAEQENSMSRIIRGARLKKLNGRRAVNLEPKNTLEIRIFRGNLVLDRFYKNIEFVLALRDFASIAHTKALDYKVFKEFVSSNGNYPHLYEYIKGYTGTQYAWGEIEDSSGGLSPELASSVSDETSGGCDDDEPEDDDDGDYVDYDSDDY